MCVCSSVAPTASHDYRHMHNIFNLVPRKEMVARCGVLPIACGSEGSQALPPPLSIDSILRVSVVCGLLCHVDASVRCFRMCVFVIGSAVGVSPR